MSNTLTSFDIALAAAFLTSLGSVFQLRLADSSHLVPVGILIAIALTLRLS